MSLFNRTYTFVDGTTAYGSQVESEINNITTVLNNLDTAATNWDQVSIKHASLVPLVADCFGGTQHIADFKNNSVIKASVDSSGNLVAAAGTFSGALTVTPITNQIVLGTTRTITLSATQPASTSRTYTFPDMGAASNVLMSATALVDNARVNAAGYIIGTTVQIIQATNTGSTASVGTAYTSTSTAASITPKATTHKIRITVTGVLQNGQLVTNQSQVSIFRGSTDLDATGQGFSQYNTNAGSGVVNTPCNMCFIDSPATTSATTYTVKVLSTVAAKSNWNPNGGTAVIVLEEVAV